MRYTTGLLAFSLAALAVASNAAAGGKVAKIEYVIFAHCERADPVLNCRIEDPNETKADISRTVQSQIRCILTHTPLADELRTALAGNLVSDLASKHLDPDLVYRPPHEQWVKMVVSLSAIEMFKPGWRVPRMGAFEIDGNNPDGCQPETFNIGRDYKSDSMHALSAYVR